MLIYEAKQPLVFNRLHYGAVENSLTPFVEIELLVRKFEEFQQDRYKDVIFGVHEAVNHKEMKGHLQTIAGLFESFIHNLALKHHAEQFKGLLSHRSANAGKASQVLPNPT